MKENLFTDWKIMEEYDEEDARLFIEFLVEEGCMEVTGVDENGEFVLSVTAKMEEMFPEIWEEIISMSNELVYELWQKDLVEIVFKNDGDILVGVNDNTLNYKQYDLSEEQIMMIETIIVRASEKRDNDSFG